MIGSMTERGLPIVDGAPACPFVAFEDDRDERATSPDHRHRCYAEARPAPRALAHQEAYCLSSAFPVCPTFQDWARREAAHSRADGPRTPDGATVLASEQPQRNPPRNWSAPPPWAGRGEPPPEDWADDAGRGLSGSYADRVASGTEAAGMPAPGPHHDDDGDLGLEAESAAGAAAAAAAAAASEQASSAPPYAAAPYAATPSAAAAPRQARGDEPPRHERRRDNAPEWERARPLEVYPTLRARRLPELSVPPLLVAVVAVALAAAVLFALPGLLGFGSPPAASSPTPSAVASVAPASITPTQVPQPTQVTYIVQSGDTMSKIAKRFHVTLDDLIAANRETIPDPDQLQIGDVVIIPVPVASSVPAASP